MFIWWQSQANTDGKGESKDSMQSNQRGVVGSRNLNMTDVHRAGLQQLKERDAKIVSDLFVSSLVALQNDWRSNKTYLTQDIEIENIGKGVDDLHELAKVANEEIKLQSKMLDTLEAKIDDVHDHVTNVNAKLKTTLEEARKSDKICMVSRSKLVTISFSRHFFPCVCCVLTSKMFSDL